MRDNTVTVDDDGSGYDITEEQLYGLWSVYYHEAENMGLVPLPYVAWAMLVEG